MERKTEAARMKDKNPADVRRAEKGGALCCPSPALWSFVHEGYSFTLLLKA